MYLVEIILVVILYSYLVIYFNPLTNFVSYIYKFQREYSIDTGMYSIYSMNINDLLSKNKLDLLNIMIDILFSRSIVYFGQTVTVSDTIYIRNISSSCSMIFYPFVTVAGMSSYLTSSPSGIFQHYDLFLVKDNKLYSCEKIYSVNDWKYLIFMQIGNNISIPVENNLDICSIFLFDRYGYPLNITGIAYDGNYLNISTNIVLNDYVILVYRIKNITHPSFNNLCNRYLILSNISSIPINRMIKGDINWLTIYIDNSCLQNNSYLIISYSIPPSLSLKKSLYNINPSQCVPANFSILGKLNMFLYQNYLSYISLGGEHGKEYEYSKDYPALNGLRLYSFIIYGS